MFGVNTWHKARQSFEFIHWFNSSMKEFGRTQKEIDNRLIDYKRELRHFVNTASDRSVIRSSYDGYVELITLPESVTNPEEYFKENEYLRCRPSPYDCTGQPFTLWYKICKRRGRYMVYHSVGIDV